MTTDTDLAACERKLHYKFKNRTRLDHALTHSSIKDAAHPSNERMEFIGDAILGQEISLFLYNEFPTFTEGELTKIKSVVVSRTVLARLCKCMDMQPHIRLGKGIQREDIPASLYANVFEALIAAIHIDGGIRASRAFIRRFVLPEIEVAVSDAQQKNYKSILQHYTQRHFKLTPAYEMISSTGPDHHKEFNVLVKVGPHNLAQGTGHSKKLAEQAAAARTMELLRSMDGDLAAAADSVVPH